LFEFSLLLSIFESLHEKKKTRKTIIGRKPKIYNSEKRTYGRPENSQILVEEVLKYKD
jgi:hypothetical protein